MDSQRSKKSSMPSAKANINAIPFRPLSDPFNEALHPPIAPPFGPTQWLFQGHPAESKLLATQVVLTQITRA
jgi:hypothetical protein